MSPASRPLDRHRAAPSRQRGMAIIGALIVVAAASVATAAIMERQTLLADTLIGERDRAQARWLLRGGLDWARVILFDDMRHNNVTIKRAIWAQPIVGFEISAPGDTRKAYFSGQIEDEQGKLNLWRLAEKGVVQPQELAALERLTTILDLPATVAPAIAQRVAEAQAGENAAQAAPGLRTVQDLLSIRDMSPDIVLALADYLTVVPEKTTINVNTASPEVLSAAIPGLDLALARSTSFQRDQGFWFASSADFFNRLNDPDIAAQNHVGVSSDWFKVTGEVSLDHASVDIQALLHRKAGGPPLIRWIKE
jgi:general secretion pathway protein K